MVDIYTQCTINITLLIYLLLTNNIGNVHIVLLLVIFVSFLPMVNTVNFTSKTIHFTMFLILELI